MQIKSSVVLGALALWLFAVSDVAPATAQVTQITPGLYTTRVVSRQEGFTLACFDFKEDRTLEVTVIPLEKLRGIECPPCMARSQSGSWSPIETPSETVTPFFQGLITGGSEADASASNTYLGTTYMGPEGRSILAGFIASTTPQFGTQVSQFSGFSDPNCLDLLTGGSTNEAGRTRNRY